jgi:hypothetical protein
MLRIYHYYYCDFITREGAFSFVGTYSLKSTLFPIGTYTPNFRNIN